MEKDTQKPRKIKKWIKRLFIAIFVLLLFLLFLFPPFFSRHMLRPAIMEAFQQSTNRKYTLNFETLYWNFFSKKIELLDINISPDLLGDSASYIILEADKTIISSISYIDLWDRSLNIKTLSVEGIELTYSYLPADTVKNYQSNTKLPFQYIGIDSLSLQLDKINLLVQKDSLLLLKESKLKAERFTWDLRNEVKEIDWPQLEKISSEVSFLKYNNKGRKLKLVNIKLSDNKSNSLYVLAEKANLYDSDSKLNISLKWPGLKVDTLRRINKDGLRNYKLGEIEFFTDSLSIKSLGSNIKAPPNLSMTLKEFATEQKISLQIEQIKVNSKITQISQKRIESNVNNLSALLEEVEWSEKNLGLASYQAKSGALWLWIDSKDSLMVKDFYIDHNMLELKQLNYLSKNRKLLIYDVDLAINNLDKDLLINNKILKADLLNFSEGTFYYQNNGEVFSKQAFKSSFGFNVKNVDFNKCNFFSQGIGLNVSSINLSLNDLDVKKDYPIHIDSIFKHLKFDAVKIEYNKPESLAYVRLDNSFFDTENSRFKTASLKLNDKNEQFEVDLISKEVRINGFNWRNIYYQFPTFKIDTIFSSNIQLDMNYAASKGEETPLAQSNLNFQISFLDFPQSEINLCLSSNESCKDIFIDDLDIKTQELNVDFKQEIPIKFFDANFASTFLSFTDTLKNLSLEARNWSFNDFDGSLEANQLEFNQSRLDSSGKIESNTTISLPELYVSGINTNDFWTRDGIEMNTVKIQHPKITSVNNKSDTAEFKHDPHLTSFLGSYKKVGIDYFQIEQGQLSIDDINGLEQMAFQVGRFDLDIEEINLNKNSYDYFLDYLISQKINLKTRDISLNYKTGDHITTIKEMNLFMGRKKLVFNDIKYISLTDSLNPSFNFKIDKIRIEDFDFSGPKNLPVLNIGSCAINHPKIEWKGAIDKIAKQENYSGSPDLYSNFKEYLTAIRIDSLNVSQVEMDWNPFVKNMTSDTFGFIADRIDIDSSNLLLSERKFFYADRFILRLPDIAFSNPNSYYQYKINSLLFDSYKNQIQIKGLHINPVYPKEVFSRLLAYQKDYVNAVFPNITLSGLNMRDLIALDEYKTERMVILRPSVEIYKDKTIPVDSASYKSMPISLLEEIPFKLNIDTVTIRNGFLKYEEYSGLLEKPGMIHFNELNANIYRLSNITNTIERDKIMSLNASANLMSKSKINLKVYFPYYSQNQNFSLMASMESLNATELNPLIQPLTLLSVKSGDMKQMQMNVLGNNDYAFGSMVLKYENIKVEVMNRRLKESGLSTFLANAFMIKKHNRNIIFPRKGPIYYERVKFRSFIHYMAHFAIVGAKTSVGIDSRKTQNKIDEVSEEEK
jgi:hypothetical protein